MPRKKSAGAPQWSDPDDAPELTASFFERASVYEGETLIRRGRPRSERPKRLVSLRLDADVVDGLRNTGRGWQTRANDALRAFLAAIPPAKP